MASPSSQVRQALSTLQGRIRQRSAENETIVKTISDAGRAPAVDLQLTHGRLDAMKAVERTVAADERFEHLVPAEGPIQEFAEDCATDRKTDHVKIFMKRYGQDAVERVCFFGVEFLTVKEPAKVAGIRLLPLDDPEIPGTNPLFKVDKAITSYAVVQITGTNDVLMAARARELAEHGLRVLRVALRQTYGLNPEQLRFRSVPRTLSPTEAAAEKPSWQWGGWTAPSSRPTLLLRPCTGSSPSKRCSATPLTVSKTALSPSGR